MLLNVSSPVLKGLNLVIFKLDLLFDFPFIIEKESQRFAFQQMPSNKTPLNVLVTKVLDWALNISHILKKV